MMGMRQPEYRLFVSIDRMRLSTSAPVFGGVVAEKKVEAFGNPDSPDRYLQ